MTTAASTIAPMAMAMPPSDMMLALTPWNSITTNAASTPNGKVRIARSEEHTSELQSLMRISYAVFCLKKKKNYTKRSDTHELKNKEYNIQRALRSNKSTIKYQVTNK